MLFCSFRFIALANRALTVFVSCLHLTIARTLGTSYLLVAIIALAILPAILHRLRVRQPKLSRRIVSLPLYRRTTAFLRCIGYVQPVVRGIFITALGPLLLIAAFGISTIAWCFAIKPYYRPSRELGCE